MNINNDDKYKTINKLYKKYKFIIKTLIKFNCN